MDLTLFAHVLSELALLFEAIWGKKVVQDMDCSEHGPADVPGFRLHSVITTTMCSRIYMKYNYVCIHHMC